MSVDYSCSINSQQSSMKLIHHPTINANILFHSVIQAKNSRSKIAIRNNSYIYTENNNPTIVIMHGLLGSTRNFRSFARLLSNKLNDEFDIVIMDLRNHGRTSFIGPLVMDYPVMALDFYHTLKYLNIQYCHVIGHSMGGKVAAMAALMNQKLVSSSSSSQSRMDHINVTATDMNMNDVNSVITKMKSLCILDICPVQYTPKDFISVYDTIDFLVESTPAIESATSRSEVMDIINTRIQDPSLRAFLLTNIQEEKIVIHHDTSGNINKPQQSQSNVFGKKFSWKLHVAEINQARESIANFPELNSDIYTYSGPTVIIKGANSNFVKSYYLDQIKQKFPNFMMTTQRDAGHWLHADQPDQTADKIAQFINYAQSKQSQ